MSFFPVRNIQEFEKQWSSCAWREAGKERCVSRTDMGLGEGGEQREPGIIPMAQILKLTLWKFSQDPWEKGREEGLPRPEGCPGLFAELPRHRSVPAAWPFHAFFAKLTVQNQPGLLRSSHKALCLTPPWEFQNSKWSKRDFKLTCFMAQFAILTPRRL